MNLMHTIFQELLDDFVIIFLDDILVYSRDVETHVTHVRQTLAILGKTGYTPRYPNVHSFSHQWSTFVISVRAVAR